MPRSIILGCSSKNLTDDERAFFGDVRPWGFILFSRNIDSPDQVRSLCDDLRRSVDNERAPIFVDQEGGRVQRLGPPHWSPYPPASHFGDLYADDPERAIRAVWVTCRLLAFDLRRLGITGNCLPVLDILTPDTHSVIGDRSYGSSPDVVLSLGRSACLGLRAGGVLPTPKHIPGHGRARCDSHIELPRVSASLEELERTDFVPFAGLSDEPIAMTAHIIYESIDSAHPATFSSTVILDIIRRRIGFQNLLVSDDISMNALDGAIGLRAERAFLAGCDIILHCNGDMTEMESLVSYSPELTGESLSRAEYALSLCDEVDDSDESSLRLELSKYWSF